MSPIRGLLGTGLEQEVAMEGAEQAITKRACVEVTAERAGGLLHDPCSPGMAEERGCVRLVGNALWSDMGVGGGCASSPW